MSNSNRNDGSSTLDHNPGGPFGSQPTFVQTAANGNNEVGIYRMLHHAHFGTNGGNRTFAAICTKVNYADKADQCFICTVSYDLGGSTARWPIASRKLGHFGKVR